MSQYNSILAQCCQKLKDVMIPMQDKIIQVQMKNRVQNDEQIQEQLSDTVSLNVGGQSGIKVRRSLLTQVPNSVLEAMFSGRHQI